MMYPPGEIAGMDHITAATRRQGLGGNGLHPGKVRELVRLPHLETHYPNVTVEPDGRLPAIGR